MRLPPLNALRAFEAAARLGSFVRAADELNVTPAAISHQVKGLEAFLGVALFRRLARGLVLTDQGRTFLPQLTRGFAHLARAADEVTTGGLSGPLTVSVLPSFATLWLVPHLQSFFDGFPDVDLRIWGDERKTDFVRDDVDLAIRHGPGNYPGLITTFILREEVFPVCAPSYLNRRSLRAPQDLRACTLLHDVRIGRGEPTLTWQRWLLDVGLTDVDPTRGPKYSDAIMLLESAARGHGLALGRSVLVADHLESGRLVRPLPLARPADHVVWAVAPPASAERPKVQAFIRWLQDEAAAAGLTSRP